MPVVRTDLCRGSGRAALDRLDDECFVLMNRRTGEAECVYVCSVCGTVVVPLRDGICPPHVDWETWTPRWSIATTE